MEQVSALPPPQALRLQSQAGELEARGTRDEHARDHGKEKGKKFSTCLPRLPARHFHSEGETSGNEAGLCGYHILMRQNFYPIWFRLS